MSSSNMNNIAEAAAKHTAPRNVAEAAAKQHELRKRRAEIITAVNYCKENKCRGWQTLRDNKFKYVKSYSSRKMYFLLEITFFYKTFLCAFRKGISTQEIQHKFKCNHKCEFKHFSRIRELLFIPNFEHLGPNCDYICTFKKVDI